MPIYLNAASHGLPDRATLEAAKTRIEAELDHGTVLSEDAAQADLARARTAAARLLDAPGARTIFGTTTTQLWQAVIGRLPLNGRRILVSPHEWGANIRHLRHLASILDLGIDVVPEDEAFDPAAWRSRIDDRTAAILLPAVTSIEGLLYPVAAIGALPRPETALVIVDAAQALGRAPVSMEAGCDVLLGTARKWLRGPRGTAVAALSPRAERTLGTGAMALEARDFNVAGRCALGVALNACLDAGVPAIAGRIAELERDLRGALAGRDISGAQVLAAAGAHAPGTVVLSVAVAERDRIDNALREQDILAKWSLPATEEPLSRLAQVGDRAFLRMTPHLYNRGEEMRVVAGALAGAGR
ncbi:aminotransferase class V-fold PLP-dependent enzyme [Paenirhodobacter populi]|uniref:Aminotransferase class V-fold PLP-dependent enzyme n=1 Tax=Paenirhodobacter populi TaxID=2306993 RepID=A0A443ILD0_9RHOB|nr:aminotransferase class V-fold PLP-dependent enzyme [Sinirhodobacter populi]RWR05815.1 aminotransferase class V-fold PLP-dependent enzyme [Sinirhodobacter populi]